jgi:AraC family transcriptional regulator of adaptative response / DNA-3-methyladenine glycosylase II
VLARDVRYDGRFFTCVKTTGIYCRPICPARPPKRENCFFVPTAAAAQEAGFRLCLRCRPESSPDLDAWRGTSATVSRALKLIESGALDDGGVASLAERLDIGERHLRRLFRRHIGAAPVTVAQTRRVLLAKQLLHQTTLSMTEVALASGFGSVRRFNETFQALYQRPPGDLRRGATAGVRAPEITLLLPYRPPYDWEAMLRFLAARRVPGLEVIENGSYRRVIESRDAIGMITVAHAPEERALRVAVRFPQLAMLPAIIARIRRMFDLSADPGAIGAVLAADPLLAPYVRQHPGLRVPGGWNGFEIAVRAILGQQVTLKAGTQLTSRVVATLGTPVSDRVQVAGLTHAFPKPARFESEFLPRLGMPKARAAALAGMAATVVADPRVFDPRLNLADAVARFQALPGIGEWTAQYIAMRALGESDAFLAGDVALQRIFRADKRPTATQLLAHAERWRPWRAYAVLHLWTAEADATRISTSPRKENNHALAA